MGGSVPLMVVIYTMLLCLSTTFFNRLHFFLQKTAFFVNSNQPLEKILRPLGVAISSSGEIRRDGLHGGLCAVAHDRAIALREQ